MNERRNGFTIIELLVVVSIIALLIGILLPAIGKARDQAHVTRSQSNIRQIVVAKATYAAEWNDRQWGLSDYTLSRYGNNFEDAVAGYQEQTGLTLLVGLGWTGGANPGHWRFTAATALARFMYMPIGLDAGSEYGYYGYFRAMNVESFNTYLSGRFYDPVFYAPKDRAVLAAIGECMDTPGSFCSGSQDGTTSSIIHWSSYCLSPAALFNPAVMTYDFWDEAGGNVDYMFGQKQPASLRVPTYSQARYPSLKTHILEHHWLQGTRADCNPGFVPGSYNGCEPYYFHHSIESIPQTAFYDGSIRGLPVREAQDADRRATTQGGENNSVLWLRNTSYGNQGYLNNYGWPPAANPPGPRSNTSFHILTNGGILGRDTFSQ